MAIERLKTPPSDGFSIEDGKVSLMRYMSFPKFLDLLNGNLSFTPLRMLRSLNDPLESRQITEAATLVGELLERAPFNLIMEDLATIAPLWLRDRILDRTSEGEHKSHAIAEAYSHFILHRRAVSCWYANNVESASMWALFARDGVAVRTTLNALEKALPRNRDFVVKHAVINN